VINGRDWGDLEFISLWTMQGKEKTPHLFQNEKQTWISQTLNQWGEKKKFGLVL